MRSRHSKNAVAVACVAAIAIAGCAGSNAPRESTAAAPIADDAAVQAALVRTCYGCHSDTGHLAWNAKLAPSAWFAGSAREKLDFSTLAGLSADRRAAALASVERVVRAGQMPPWDSVLFDATAKLTPAEKDGVVRWASAAAGDASR